MQEAVSCQAPEKQQAVLKKELHCNYNLAGVSVLGIAAITAIAASIIGHPIIKVAKFAITFIIVTIAEGNVRVIFKTLHFFPAIIDASVFANRIGKVLKISIAASIMGHDIDPTAAARTVCRTNDCIACSSINTVIFRRFFIFFYLAAGVSSLTDAVFVVFDKFIFPFAGVAALSGRSVPICFFLRLTNFISLSSDNFGLDRESNDGKED